MLHLIDILFSYLTVGAAARLCITCKQSYVYRYKQTTLHASLHFSNVRVTPNYTWVKYEHSSRCNECGTTRSITKFKRYNLCPVCGLSLTTPCQCPGLKLCDYHACMTCARDPGNFRYLVNRTESYPFAISHSQGRLLLKKRVFFLQLAKIKPKMLTRKMEFLYDPREILKMAYL